MTYSFHAAMGFALQVIENLDGIAATVSDCKSQPSITQLPIRTLILTCYI